MVRPSSVSHLLPPPSFADPRYCSLGELHVNPVTLTFQLRPYLNYLDHAVTLERRKKREEAKNPDESDGEMSDTELKKLESKAVQVSVKQSADLSGGGAFGKSGGSGGGNGRASSSLFDPLRAMEGEQWRHMQHTPVDVSLTPHAPSEFEIRDP
jgi:DNA-directed RNA polymerase-3 subunit RPC5